jgi:hypothetical protein
MSAFACSQELTFQATKIWWTLADYSVGTLLFPETFAALDFGPKRVRFLPRLISIGETC